MTIKPSENAVAQTAGELWSDQFDAYNKAFNPWIKRMDKIVRRYRDESDSLESPSGTSVVDGVNNGKYNVYYSNVSVLQPATYNHTPQPVVSRRYADRDPVARVASDILQRCLSTTIEDHFDQMMEQVRDDYLHGCRGTNWVRYEVEFEDQPLIDPLTLQPIIGDDGEPVFPIKYECTKVDFVEAKDFAHTPVRKWDDVWWCGRKLYLDRKAAVKLLGKKEAAKLSYNEHSTKPVTDNAGKGYDKVDAKGDAQKRAEVWEIWDKKNRKVIFWSESCKESTLKEQDVPLDFKEFFPCPRPCYGILTNGSLIPVPFFTEYQDQARELDILTQRMDNLLGACKVSGLFDSSFGVDVQTMFQSSELQMTPVENLVAKYTEKGGRNGLESVIMFNPVDMFAKVYDQLRAAREQLKRDIDEITGISDIVRGYSAPNATATAEQIKSSYATLRLERMKGEIARFARDTLRLQGEIICEAFQDQTILDMAGVEFMQPDFIQNAPQALNLLRNDKQRTFRVDIETDSTVAIDEAEDKKDRLEFLTTMSEFLKGAMEIGQQAPELAPLLKESVMFAVRSFKAGRQMEGNFEQALDAMVNKTKNPAPPPPDPKMIEAQQNAQLKQQEAQQNAQLAATKAQQDAQLQQQKAASDQQTAQIKAKADIEAKMMEVNADILASEREAMAKIESDERIALARIAMDERVSARQGSVRSNE